jgi:hypothetical protein
MGSILGRHSRLNLSTESRRNDPKSSVWHPTERACSLRFEHAPQQVTLLDLAGEVDHTKVRLERLASYS